MFSAEIMGDLVKNSKEKQKNASVQTEAFIYRLKVFKIVALPSSKMSTMALRFAPKKTFS